MIIDIKHFYSSISKKLLDNSIKFAWHHLQLKREYFNIIQHARKSFLYNMEIPAYDGAEVCEIVGFFLLNKFAKNI